MKLAPELLRHLGMHVHTDEYFCCAELLIGMAYAVGDVRRHAHLGLHVYVGSRCILRHALQQALTLLLLARHVIVVVHHIESHHLRSVLWTAHHHSQIDQSLGIFRIAHGYEHLLLAFVCRSVFGHFLVTQGYLLRRAFGHYGGDDAREEYHYYHSVEHIVGDERHARLHLHLHAHHHHGNGARSMCRRESEHHIARRYGQAEQPTGEIGSHCLAHRSEHYYHYHYAHYAASGKQQSQIDEHAHTYKKIRYE